MRELTDQELVRREKAENILEATSLEELQREIQKNDHETRIAYLEEICEKMKIDISKFKYGAKIDL